MTIVPHEEFAFPPLEAFLITPRFVASDLWVWPLYVVLLFLWLRSIHKAAGLTGRGIDILTAVRVLNGLFLWGSIIALGNAVHRVTDDAIVSGLWVGVVLTLSNLAYQGVLKYSPLAPIDKRARAAVDASRAEARARQEAYKQAKARGQMFVDQAPSAADAASDGPVTQPVRRQRVHVARDSPADARQQVSVLMRRDLFADPAPPSEPAPNAEKPPVA